MHLEVHVEDLPANFQYLEIEVGDSISRDTISVSDLGAGWRLDVERTRKAGDEWLASRRSALLFVPSVLVPATWNVLLNPLHADAEQVKLLHSHWHPLDARLLA